MISEESLSLRVVKNEKLLCINCLKSGDRVSGTTEALYCHLNHEPETKHVDNYCSQGVWLIDGRVVDFKEGFQILYNKQNLGREKEIITA